MWFDVGREIYTTGRKAGNYRSQLWFDVGRERLRSRVPDSAYFCLKRNMPMPWTFYDRHEIGLPNTNSARRTFSDLKIKVRVHMGISRDNRSKLLDEYIYRNY